MTKSLLIIIFCGSLTGCQQLKSSLQMNSDSPSPFLGLQLAVDTDTPGVQIPSTMRGGLTQPAESAGLSSQSLDQSTNLAGPRRATDFRFTASENPINGDLKMALPKSAPKSGSREAEQLADLLHRLKRS